MGEYRYTEANDLSYYLWDNGELKREQVQKFGERVGKHYAHPGYPRFHDQRDVQILAEKIADIWVEEVPKARVGIEDARRSKLLGYWGTGWFGKYKEARKIYIAAFIVGYNKGVQEYEAAEEAERREKEARRRAEQVRTSPPQPVYTPPPQPKPQPKPQPPPQPQPQPQPMQPPPPPQLSDTAKKEGVTLTIKKIERLTDRVRYFLEINHPGVTDDVETLTIAHPISTAASASASYGVAASDVVRSQGYASSSADVGKKSGFTVEGGGKFNIER